jgi:hypothetical protein
MFHAGEPPSHLLLVESGALTNPSPEFRIPSYSIKTS